MAMTFATSMTRITTGIEELQKAVGQVDPVIQLEDLHLSPIGHEMANFNKPIADTNVVSTRPRLSVQLEKLALPRFDGDITKFQQFWCSSVHKDEKIDLNMKYLYLQTLLTGDANVVLQDLEPNQDNYHHLELPTASDFGSDMRSTWIRISGILHSLRRYEDLNKVLSIIDLVHFFGTDFDLQQVMAHLDNIISPREKFEVEITVPSVNVHVQVHVRVLVQSHHLLHMIRLSVASVIRLHIHPGDVTNRFV
ncbi:hypothetical protein ANCCAN_14071 [Ancylostoma caninum]|uniref:Uncharacterized protein n=1 Tax=Ancylostoma caninum TaxID=29170 RepID=A0A368G6F4_ANCCA|nr:hypothetical protein ANCCAN_14071 [Ancylostoma caninum]